MKTVLSPLVLLEDRVLFIDADELCIFHRLETNNIDILYKFLHVPCIAYIFILYVL